MSIERRASLRTVLAFLAISGGVSCAPIAPKAEPTLPIPKATHRDDFALFRVKPIPETRERVAEISELETTLLERLAIEYESRRFHSDDPVRYLCNKLPEITTLERSGEFSWPTMGPIYGWFSTFHQGLDIAPSYGMPIYSAEEGIVVGEFYWRSSYGHHLLIYHGASSMTVYAHMSLMYPSIGERVKKNQLIGRVGMSGYATGPHLHFELLQGCLQVDPLNHLPYGR